MRRIQIVTALLPILILKVHRRLYLVMVIYKGVVMLFN